MTGPVLLDLFCGAGGAAMGYHRAGFEVVGVDRAPQPRYPFTFVRADALDYLADARGFAAVHASPPCQRYSQAVKIADRERHPDMIDATRAALRAAGVPYVIENVPSAPLRDAVQLCGSSFGLPIRRHRLFESNVFLMVPPCAHEAYPRVYPPAWNRTTPLRVLSISGGYQHRELAEYAAAMGVDWPMTKAELSNAIPPAYTELLGSQLIPVCQTSSATAHRREPDASPG